MRIPAVTTEPPTTETGNATPNHLPTVVLWGFVTHSGICWLGGESLRQDDQDPCFLCPVLSNYWVSCSNFNNSLPSIWKPWEQRGAVLAGEMDGVEVKTPQRPCTAPRTDSPGLLPHPVRWGPQPDKVSRQSLLGPACPPSSSLLLSDFTVHSGPLTPTPPYRLIFSQLLSLFNSFQYCSLIGHSYEGISFLK